MAKSADAKLSGCDSGLSTETVVWEIAGKLFKDFLSILRKKTQAFFHDNVQLWCFYLVIRIQ